MHPLQVLIPSNYFPVSSAFSPHLIFPAHSPPSFLFLWPLSLTCLLPLPIFQHFPLLSILTFSSLLVPLHFHSAPCRHELFLLCSTDHYDKGLYDYHWVLLDIHWWFSLTALVLALSFSQQDKADFDAMLPLLCKSFFFTFWYSLFSKRSSMMSTKDHGISLWIYLTVHSGHHRYRIMVMEVTGGKMADGRGLRALWLLSWEEAHPVTSFTYVSVF